MAYGVENYRGPLAQDTWALTLPFYRGTEALAT